MKKLLLICLSIYFLTPLFSNEYDGLLIHDYTFCPEKNNVFNIIVKKQNLNDDDLAPKTIIVKKGNKELGRMKTISLPENNVGEGYQFITVENNTFTLQETLSGGKYIYILLLTFEYKNNEIVFTKFIEKYVDRYAEIQEIMIKKEINITNNINFSDVNDEIIFDLHLNK